MKTCSKPKVPAQKMVVKTPNIATKSEAQAKQISETLKESYAKGRRFRKYGGG